jgi:hypothetical protein
LSDTANGNVARSSSGALMANSGHAVNAYFDKTSRARKETTAGPSVNLFFNNGSFSGGWDN